jgi:drug/metabolite transporter (DMT)-like permease
MEGVRKDKMRNNLHVTHHREKAMFDIVAWPVFTIVLIVLCVFFFDAPPEMQPGLLPLHWEVNLWRVLMLCSVAIGLLNSIKSVTTKKSTGSSRPPEPTRSVKVKKRAHLFALLSVCCAPFSLLALILLAESISSRNAAVLEVVVIFSVLTVQILCLALTIYFFIREKRSQIVLRGD